MLYTHSPSDTAIKALAYLLPIEARAPVVHVTLLDSCVAQVRCKHLCRDMRMLGPITNAHSCPLNAAGIHVGSNRQDS